MKVIISGVTGLIGGEVLQQCLEDQNITTICTLSRRPLPESLRKSPKVNSIVLDDFLHYSENVLSQLAGAEACFWTIGISSLTFPPNVREIDVGYSQAAAKAFARHLQPQLPAGKKFRFVHVSGIFAEPDPERPLWLLQEGRRSKGASEVAMIKFGEEHLDVFQAYVVRAGVVLPKDSALTSFWEWLLPSFAVDVKHLALGMVTLVQDAGPGGVVKNQTIVQRGQKAALDKS